MLQGYVQIRRSRYRLFAVSHKVQGRRIVVRQQIINVSNRPLVLQSAVFNQEILVGIIVDVL